MFCVTCSKELTGTQTVACSKVCKIRLDSKRRRESGKLRKENMTQEAYARKQAASAKDRERNGENRQVLRACAVCGETRKMDKAHALTRPVCMNCHATYWNNYKAPPLIIDRQHIPTEVKGSVIYFQNCGYCKVQFLTQHQPSKCCSSSCKRRLAAGNGKKSKSRWINKSKRQEIYSRDNWVCQLCFEPVSQEDWSGYDPKAASLDHIVPSSHGGSDHPENLRLTHMICNSVRGVHGDDEGLVLVADYLQG